MIIFLSLDYYDLVTIKSINTQQKRSSNAKRVEEIDGVTSGFLQGRLFLSSDHRIFVKRDCSSKCICDLFK